MQTLTMGLQNFNITPDDKGGRPSKSENSKRKARNPGEAYCAHKHGEDYWKRVYLKFVDGKEVSDEEMATMCEYTQSLPHIIKKQLQDHGIHDFGLEEWTGSKASSTSTSSSTSSSSSSNSGFGAIIENAK